MYPGSGDSDLESDFALQNDRLPFVSGAANGIVLPSSGRSGNKNLNGNTQKNVTISLQEVSANHSIRRRDWRGKNSQLK